MRIDARIPVVFAPTPAQPGDRVLAEGLDFAPVPSPDHVPGCACCSARNPVASLLGGLFFARARGEVAFFRRVVVRAATPAGRQAIESALDQDPVASGCYKRG